MSLRLLLASFSPKGEKRDTISYNLAILIAG